MRLYLDNCCYNRPFDDQEQLRIRLEAQAKLGIQDMIRAEKMELAWSYMIDFENEQNPFDDIKAAISKWRSLAVIDTGETEGIIARTKKLAQLGLKGKDAIHLACAVEMKCDYFITTDDYIIRKSAAISEIRVTDPIDFIRELT
jgi:predicted nucleic acid-binding protein